MSWSECKKARDRRTCGYRCIVVNNTYTVKMYTWWCKNTDDMRICLNLNGNLLHAWQREVGLLRLLLAVVLLEFVQVCPQQLCHQNQMFLSG